MIAHANVLGHRLEYTWIGDANAPAVVMLHDSLGSIRTWKDFPATLASATGRSVLNYSRQGFGGSDAFNGRHAKDYMHHEGQVVLPALLEQLQVKHPVLFGHSDGATIALICAGAHPSLPQAIVLEAPHVFVEPVTLAGIEQAKTAYKTTDLRAKLSRYHGDPDAVFSHWTDTWTAPEFRDWNAADFVPKIRCPALMIQGLDDEYGSPAQIDAIAAGRPDRSVVLLEACGHSPHRDQPAAVLAATAEFLRKI
jgi:pimeloyl-ACP methyl ester carboxylesterase